MINPLPSPRHAQFLTLLLSLCTLVTVKGNEAGEQPADSHHEAEANPTHALPPSEENTDKLQEAQGLLTLGTNLTEREDYQAAEIAFRRILSSSEFGQAAQKDALIGIARMYRRSGSHTKAAAIYEKFLKEFPDENRVPDVLLDLGRTLRDMGAHKLAISRFYSVINSALKMPPEGFDHYQLLAKTAQFEIAETHFSVGNFVEAGKFYSRLRLLDLAPVDRARAHFKSGYSQLLADENEAAVKTLREYLQKWPDDENVPEARYLLSTTLRKINRGEEAMSATLSLLKSEQANSAADPKRWAYWQRRTGNQLANEFFENGDTMYALAIYQGLVTLSPEPVWKLSVTYQTALCYERLRLLDRARTAYKTIVDTVAETTSAPSPTPEMIELAKMASWRLAHLDWSDQTERQLNAFFSTTTGQSSTSTASPSLPQ